MASKNRPRAGTSLKGLNLKDKIVLVLSEAPGKDDPKSPFNKTKELKEKYFLRPRPCR